MERYPKGQVLLICLRIGNAPCVVPAKRCFDPLLDQVLLPKKGLKLLDRDLDRRRTVLRACSQTIKKTLDMVESMLKLAEEGDAVREDVGCGILYAVLRDSAYKIKKLAEAEREAHTKKGWWGE